MVSSKIKVQNSSKKLLFYVTKKLYLGAIFWKLKNTKKSL